MNRPDVQSHLENQERAFRRHRIKRPAASELRRKQRTPAPPSIPFSTKLRLALTAAFHRISWKAVLLLVFAALLIPQGIYLSRSIRERRLRQQEIRIAQEERDKQLQKIRALEDAAPESCEIRYLIPNQPDLVEQIPYGGTAILHEPVELEGYTFLNWLAPDGEAETRESFPLYADLVLTAHYALPLETEEHIPYLSADRDGVVDVDARVTMRDCVIALYRLLNIDRVGQGRFLDVTKKDPCYKAAATLKDLGILEGNYLFPDDPLRFQELLELLERFYPATDAVYEFPALNRDSDACRIYSTAAAYGWIDPDTETDPGAPVTRGELARLLNRVLHRDQAHPRASQVGMILDVAPEHPYFADIAEAVIPHDYVRQDSAEVWTDSTPLPSHEPGLFFAGVRLHCISETGRPLRNTTVDGRRFNASGELTSGDAELDRKLWAILEELVDPRYMEEEEMLRIVYDYVCDEFTPGPAKVYEVGAEDWAVREAKQLLETGTGDSYGYAALFYELSYFIGYQPVLYSGSIYGEQTAFETDDGVRVESHPGYMPYGWVEISFDRVPYIFDPAGESRVDPNRIYFKRNNPIRWQRGYRSDVF